jgi:protein translocase SecG subunit
MTLYIISCFVLIMFVLLQPGKSDAAQVFGGGGNSSAFGARGTQTVLAKVTITAAIVFFLIAFLFSIPGLFEERSLGEGVGPAEAPATAPITPGATNEQATPAPTEQAPSQAAPAPAPQAPKQDDKKPQ